MGNSFPTYCKLKKDKTFLKRSPNQTAINPLIILAIIIRENEKCNGENEIKITLTGSLRNLLGPFHHIEGETPKALPFYFFKKTSIWGWGDGTNHNWTEDYSFVQNGLFFK